MSLCLSQHLKLARVSVLSNFQTRKTPPFTPRVSLIRPRGILLLPQWGQIDNWFAPSMNIFRLDLSRYGSNMLSCGYRLGLSSRERIESSWKPSFLVCWLILKLEKEMRGRDGPTGRANFVNTNFLRQMRQEHVYKIIFVLMKFRVTISVLNPLIRSPKCLKKICVWYKGRRDLILIKRVARSLFGVWDFYGEGTGTYLLCLVALPR